MAYTMRFKTVKLKCDKHTRFNPDKQGGAGIKGGCEDCKKVMAAYEAMQTVEELVQPFRTQGEPAVPDAVQS